MANHANQSRSIRRKREALQQASAEPMAIPDGIRLLGREKRLFAELADCVPADLHSPAVARILVRAVRLQTELETYEKAVRKAPFVTAQTGVYEGQPIPNPAQNAKLAVERALATALRQAGLTLHAASSMQARNNAHERDVQKAKQASSRREDYAHLIGGKQRSAMN